MTGDDTDRCFTYQRDPKGDHWPTIHLDKDRTTPLSAHCTCTSVWDPKQEPVMEWAIRHTTPRRTP